MQTQYICGIPGENKLYSFNTKQSRTEFIERMNWSKCFITELPKSEFVRIALETNMEVIWEEIQ